MNKRDAVHKHRRAGKDEGQEQGPGPEVLHAPWRDIYMQELSSCVVEGSSVGSDEGTFFAEYWNHPEHDRAHHVVVRKGEGQESGMILLNKFPYANGHVLVALAEARPTLRDYSPAQRHALWDLIDLACDLVEKTLQPQGLNIGINQGGAAGAGVPGHLHAHVVPRWHGDVNFMAVVGNVRVIPSSLEIMWERMRSTWEAMREGSGA